MNQGQHVKSDLVDQAVFTSARGNHREGYHLVVASSGIADAEAQELSRLGPSHDSLSEDSSAAGSVNFSTLSSGRFCVSRTTKEGAEYSARGAQRIHTHILVVPPSVFLRFGNNPFRVVEAALAGGKFDNRDPIPASLDSFPLLGRASPIDRSVVNELVDTAGPFALANLVQSAINATNLAIKGTIPTEKLMAGLLSLIPPQCRPEISFSTGLRYSPSRPFRILGIESSDPNSTYALARTHEMVSVDYVSARTECLPALGVWARCLVAILRNQELDALELVYKSLSNDVQLSDLDHEAANLSPQYDDSCRESIDQNKSASPVMTVRDFVKLSLHESTSSTSREPWLEFTKRMQPDDLSAVEIACFHETVELWRRSNGGVSAENAMSFLSSIVSDGLSS